MDIILTVLAVLAAALAATAVFAWVVYDPPSDTGLATLCVGATALFGLLWVLTALRVDQPGWPLILGSCLISTGIGFGHRLRGGGEM